ncbi:uncharacterized protein [Montipora foliosa]|uniref:uncharacterized protein n=1 Tax=Montipora foliosa TaxID=591990 RepID=UPI0035F1C07D
MGKGDRFVVFGCNNDRRYPEKHVMKEHTSFFGEKPQIRFWSCKDPKRFTVWTKQLGRKYFKVSKDTKVCSNHFEFGKPTDSHPDPSLFLKGYDKKSVTRKRKSPMVRPTLQPKLPKVKKIKELFNEKEEEQNDVIPDLEPEQNVERGEAIHISDTDLISGETSEDFSASVRRDELEGVNISREREIIVNCCKDEKYNGRKVGQQSNTKARGKPKCTKESHPEFSINKIKHCDDLMKLYTGCTNYNIFLFIFKKVKAKSGKLCFHNGKVTRNDISETKNYQKSPTKPGCRKNPGPRCEINAENQMLMTLMKLRLNLHTNDLAFRCSVSVPSLSCIMSTWIGFLGREVELLLYFPSEEETLSYTPKCFVGNLKKVEIIIDCTEQRIAQPSHAKLQYQTYSTYKSANTLKKTDCLH